MGASSNNTTHKDKSYYSTVLTVRNYCKNKRNLWIVGRSCGFVYVFFSEGLIGAHIYHDLWPTVLLGFEPVNA